MSIYSSFGSTAISKLPHLVASFSSDGFSVSIKGQLDPHILLTIWMSLRFGSTDAQRGKLFYRLAQQALMVDSVLGHEIKANVLTEEEFDDLER